MKRNIKTIFSRELPFFWSVPAVAWQMIFFYVPMLFVVFMSFKKLGSDIFFHFTLQNYQACLNWSVAHIILRSLVCSLTTASCCLLIGYPVAYYLARKTTRWKNTLLFFLVLPFWTNMLVQVYAWFAILEYKGIINSLFLDLGLISEPLILINNVFAIYMVMIYYYMPFMVIPIYVILEKLEDEYLQASFDLGATPVQTFFKVTLPLSMSGIITGFFLVFVPAFGEFVIPGLMGGNKFMYVGSLITYYYLNMRNQAIGAACTVISVLVLATASFVLYRFFSLFGARERE